MFSVGFCDGRVGAKLRSRFLGISTKLSFIDTDATGVPLAYAHLCRPESDSCSSEQPPPHPKESVLTSLATVGSGVSENI